MNRCIALDSRSMEVCERRIVFLERNLQSEVMQGRSIRLVARPCAALEIGRHLVLEEPDDLSVTAESVCDPHECDAIIEALQKFEAEDVAVKRDHGVQIAYSQHDFADTTSGKGTALFVRFDCNLVAPSRSPGGD